MPAFGTLAHLPGPVCCRVVLVPSYGSYREAGLLHWVWCLGRWPKDPPKTCTYGVQAFMLSWIARLKLRTFSSTWTWITAQYNRSQVCHVHIPKLHPWYAFIFIYIYSCARILPTYCKHKANIWHHQHAGRCMICSQMPAACSNAVRLSQVRVPGPSTSSSLVEVALMHLRGALDRHTAAFN